MLEVALKLFDYLLQLLDKKEGHKDEYFDRYIEPMYKLAEDIYYDYLEIFTRISVKIQERTSLEELIKYLEEGRKRYLPLRMKLRAEINQRFPKVNITESSGRFLTGAVEVAFEGLSPFEKGILGILMGGIAPFEQGDNTISPYGGSHTLLDLMYKFTTYSVNDMPESRYQIIIDDQRRVLEHAWADVVAGYAVYEALARPKLKSPKSKLGKPYEY